MSIVVVGTVAFDSVETPSGRSEYRLGGSASYFALAASNFVSVKLVAAVGEDFHDDHRAILRERGIDLDGLVTVAGGKTFCWCGRYGCDPNDRETIRTDLNVLEGYKPVLPASYRRSSWLFLGNIDPEIQLRVLDQVEGRPFVGCDTMNFWIERKRESLEKLLKRIDFFFVNDSEAKQLVGKANVVQAAEAILSMGPRAVIIKKGEHGALLFSSSIRFFAPAYPLEEVVDPTGAGDSFAGGFMGYIASRGSLEDKFLRRAMLFGTITASYACESFSVERLRELTGIHISTRLGELVDLVHIDFD